jgi:hypothetical protein
MMSLPSIWVGWLCDLKSTRYSMKFHEILWNSKFFSQEELMSFNQTYTELLVILPTSIIHEVWIHLTIRKRNPLSVSTALFEKSGILFNINSHLEETFSNF